MADDFRTKASLVFDWTCQECKKKGYPSSVRCDDLPPGYVKLYYCSKCHDYLFCSKECQKKNWKWHKTMCPRTVKEREDLHKVGEQTIEERKVAAFKSGYKHALTTSPGTTKAKYDLLFEGENRINTMVGILYENEEQAKDEMCAGVSLHVDGAHCAIMRNSKLTKVKIVRAGSGEEIEVPRLQMKMLSTGDRIVLHFPPASPCLLFSKPDYVMEYKRENTTGN